MAKPIHNGNQFLISISIRENGVGIRSTGMDFCTIKISSLFLLAAFIKIISFLLNTVRFSPIKLNTLVK